ncbi:class I tRNA ligase family protein [Candidatus Nomurabacteria bacterium]|nr:class I tRNA ligase family protein [Candidatus Nomurabacteria bacterium]
MNNYDHKGIERKWQERWEKDGIYTVSDKEENKDNFYTLVEFTYPSGDLHVGHWYAFAVPDIFARYKRMQGYNSLYPMGFDAFGLPAENAAIKLGADPKVWTYEQMDKMRGQFKTMGASFDWDREVVSCDPNYYKWTQWMFNQFLKNDLVYRDTTKVNWCPKDKTVLANEQVVDGKCERCGSEVEQKNQDQWMIRITKYADRLIDDLDILDWPDAIKDAQKAWIGRSEGSEISFSLNYEKEKVKNEYFKFRPELVELIEKGLKTVTFRMEAKNVSVGDIVSLINWSDGKESNQKEFDKAKIIKVSEHKLGDLPLDYPGHEKDSSVEKRLARYQEYYGDHITNDSTVYIYEFLPLSIRVFTTRADTLFGVTYVVLAPEHPLVNKLLDQVENKEEVEKYIEETKKKSELERQIGSKDPSTGSGLGKTGVELKGITAINPANGEEVPVWIADYVLAGYGTGAVMAVPAHDERDFEFAKKYGLDSKIVIVNSTGECTDDAISRNVVKSFIEKDGNVYLVRDIGPSGKSYWSLPGGGYEDAEDDISALTREIMEETPFRNIKIGQFIGASRHCYDFKAIKNSRLTKIFYASYDIENKNSNPQVPGNWFPKDEAIRMLLEDGIIIEGNILSNYFEGKINTDNGILINSGNFNEITSEEAKKKITEFVGGKMVKTYRLRDWGISRQRYWGCPIPIVYDPEGKAHAIPDEHLPWILPTDVDHTPDGTPPLARSKELFERTEKIFGEGWKPEVETMDTFVDSSWYFYRYLDNKNEKEFASIGSMDAWMPIDMYMGGAEHTTMHLLYSRFWTKALYDLGLVKDNEAYKMRRNRGLILGPDGNKMSKSKGNVINPDEVVDRLGADTVRLYLCFMGPYGVTVNYPWDPNGVVGVRRFLERVWKLKEKIDPEKKVCRTDPLVHKTIKGVTSDMEEFKFNTAISKMMILSNALEGEDKIVEASYKALLRLLSPFAPHITEELWQSFGHSSSGSEQGTESIHLSSWPEYDESMTKDETVMIGIQINGKVRGEVEVGDEDTEESVRKKVVSIEKIKPWLEGKEIKKFIYVSKKIVNIVV